MKYLLDTTFLIDHLRGQSDAVARLAKLFEDGARLYVNEVVVCEVATGSRLDPDPDLDALLEPLEFIQPGPDAARTAGRWRALALRTGHTLSLADALIAAAAEAERATVITRNVRDFSRTPVSVESY